MTQAKFAATCFAIISAAIDGDMHGVVALLNELSPRELRHVAAGLAMTTAAAVARQVAPDTMRREIGAVLLALAADVTP